MFALFQMIFRTKWQKMNIKKTLRRRNEMKGSGTTKNEVTES